MSACPEVSSARRRCGRPAPRPCHTSDHVRLHALRRLPTSAGSPFRCPTTPSCSTSAAATSPRGAPTCCSTATRAPSTPPSARAAPRPGSAARSSTPTPPTCRSRDGAFDYAICSNLLEHVADPVAVAAELTRVGTRGLHRGPRGGERQDRRLPEPRVVVPARRGGRGGPTLVMTAKRPPYFDAEIDAYIERAGVRDQLDAVLNRHVRAPRDPVPLDRVGQPPHRGRARPGLLRRRRMRGAGAPTRLGGHGRRRRSPRRSPCRRVAGGGTSGSRSTGWSSRSTAVAEDPLLERRIYRLGEAVRRTGGSVGVVRALVPEQRGRPAARSRSRSSTLIADVAQPPRAPRAGSAAGPPASACPTRNSASEPGAALVAEPCGTAARGRGRPRVTPIEE